MPSKTTLMMIAAFALGCAATRAFVVPPAHAQTAQRWEYFCFGEYGPEDVMAKANTAGEQGWEMVATGGKHAWCFKRAK